MATTGLVLLASLALYRHGGDSWRTWSKGLRPIVDSGQKRSGPDRGTWDPEDDLGLRLGRTGTTALRLLAQQT